MSSGPGARPARCAGSARPPCSQVSTSGRDARAPTISTGGGSAASRAKATASMRGHSKAARSMKGLARALSIGRPEAALKTEPMLHLCTSDISGKLRGKAVPARVADRGPAGAGRLDADQRADHLLRRHRRQPLRGARRPGALRRHGHAGADRLRRRRAGRGLRARRRGASRRAALGVLHARDPAGGARAAAGGLGADARRAPSSTSSTCPGAAGRAARASRSRASAASGRSARRSPGRWGRPGSRSRPWCASTGRTSSR